MSHRASRRTVLTAVALAMVTAPAAPAAAAGAYWDDNGTTHERQIEGLAEAGVTRSCDPPVRSQYCPGVDIPREQMAAFLNRALSLPAPSRDHFTDDEGSIFEDDINRLAEAGITKGCNPPANDEFCPELTVTRGQMAAFLDRAYDTPDRADDAFTDDEDSVFEGNINRIEEAGITIGCNPPENTRYCPEENVRRDQMASFLVRADGDLRALDPDRLHERTVTYDVRAFDGDVDPALVPVLAERAAEAMYAALSWNIRHRLLIEEVADGNGDFTLWLTDDDDVGDRAPVCSDAWSCTVGDDIYINEANFVDRPSTWAGRTQADYQRYLVMHETGHWFDFDETGDAGEPSHYNDERYCYDQDGDGDRDAPVMKQQSIELGTCSTNVFPLPFERDCVEEAWLADTTNQGDGDGDIDDQCPHAPDQR